MGHRLGVQASDQRAQGIAVIGFAGEHGAAGLVFEQRGRLGDIAGLAGGDDEAQGPAERIGEQVDLGRQSASGTPPCLILGPPFPPAACWCARTIVLSSLRYWLSRSAVSAVNTRSHTPA